MANSKTLLTAPLVCAIAALVSTACLAGEPAASAAPPLVMGHAEQLVVKSLTPMRQRALTVTSPAFVNGGDIPFENTQYRGNVFPGLAWTAGPKGTRSYVVVMQGQGPRPGSPTSIHLVLFDVPANVTRLEAGMTAPPAGAVYGPNVHGLNQPYAGPHTHTPVRESYYLQVLALDRSLGLPANASFEDIVNAMTGHVLASGELLGIATMDPNAA